VKRKLDKSVLDRGKHANLMLYDKVLFFQQTALFEDVPGVILSYLADATQTVNLDTGNTLVIDEATNFDFYVIFEGEVAYYDRHNKITTYQPGQFVGERITHPGYLNSNLLKAEQKAVLLKINKDQFYELLAEHIRLADKFLEYI
ncbi:MAG TPA: hypothetical protein PKH83_07185, partial [Cyclobacteriaceae bacterium]|nr:hypothetical protein [Cyclobacteriaceae bacterium]